MTVVFKYLQRRVNDAAKAMAEGRDGGDGEHFLEELRLLEEEYSSDLAPLLKAIDEELCSSCVAFSFSSTSRAMDDGLDEIVNPDRGYGVWYDDLPF